MSLDLPKLKPIYDYMRLQGRFRHLSDDTIKQIQQRVTEEYQKLIAKTEDQAKEEDK